MTDNHLMFLVTLPIHDGSMKVRRKVRRQSQKVRGHTYNREQAKNILKFGLSVIFVRKLQNSNLKHN